LTLLGWLALLNAGYPHAWGQDRDLNRVISDQGVTLSVAVRDNQVFYSRGRQLRIMDVTRPEVPQLIGHVDLPMLITGIALSGSHAYLSCLEAGLQVVDIGNPAAPCLDCLLPNNGYRAGRRH